MQFPGPTRRGTRGRVRWGVLLTSGGLIFPIVRAHRAGGGDRSDPSPPRACRWRSRRRAPPVRRPPILTCPMRPVGTGIRRSSPPTTDRRPSRRRAGGVPRGPRARAHEADRTAHPKHVRSLPVLRDSRQTAAARHGAQPALLDIPIRIRRGYQRAYRRPAEIQADSVGSPVGMPSA